MKEALAHIKEKSSASVDLVAIEGTHHFHMLKPVEAAEIAVKCFNEYLLKVKFKEHFFCL